MELNLVLLFPAYDNERSVSVTPFSFELAAIALWVNDNPVRFSYFTACVFRFYLVAGQLCSFFFLFSLQYILDFSKFLLMVFLDVFFEGNIRYLKMWVIILNIDFAFPKTIHVYREVNYILTLKGLELGRNFLVSYQT